jgi:CHAT domain-containing protein/tetratricopeptide (TPR) repeat protein
MQKLLFLIFFSFLTFNTYSQEIPNNPNLFDLDSNRVGTWTILYNYDWKITNDIDSVKFYRIINFIDGKPSGKVFDFYSSGQKQWEGYLIADKPDDVFDDGKSIWFDKKGEITQETIKEGKKINDFYFLKNQKVLSVEIENDIVVSYNVLVNDSTNEVLEILYNLNDYDLGDDNNYINFYLFLQKYEEKIHGKQHANYARLLNNLSVSYSDIGDFKNALNSAIECKEICDIIFDTLDTAYVLSLNNLASMYKNIGDFKKSLIFNLESIDLHEKLYGKKHLEYAMALNNLALVYHELGDFDNALSLSLEALSIKEKINGRFSSDYALALNNLALVYSDLGKFSKSLELNIQALEIYENLYGQENTSYALSLNNLASCYQELGMLNEALDYTLESISIYNKIYGKYHPDYAIALSNLGSIYSDLGNSIKSFESYLESLEIREVVFGKNHPSYALSLNNIANSYSVFGDDEKALELYLEALSINEEIYGTDHPTYLLTYTNLAMVYGDLNFKEKEFDMSLQALEINEKIHGKNHPNYAHALNNLAFLLFYDFADYDWSLELLAESKNIHELIYGVEHPLYANVISYFASFYHSKGDYDMALEYRNKSLKLHEKIYDKKHPNYILEELNLAYLYSDLKDFKTSYSILLSILKTKISNVTKLENSINQHLVINSYNNIFMYYEELFNLSQRINTNSLIDDYDILCFLKGRELSRSTSVSSYINSSNNDTLIKLYNDWLLVNKNIFSSFEMSLEKKNEMGFDIQKLKDKSFLLERELLKKSNVFANNQKKYSFNDISSLLNDDEIYIDIFISPTLNFDSSYYEIADSNKYYAVITFKSDTIPKLIDLGYSCDFERSFINYTLYTKKRPMSSSLFSSSIRNSYNIYLDFWSPFEDYLNGISKVYFSSEGVFSKINPNVLYDSLSNNFLIDKYDINFVSNVEDFVTKKKKTKLFKSKNDLNAVIIGNPSFLLDENEAVFASNQNISRSLEMFELDTLKRGFILSDLPGTQIEIDLISDNLKSKGWSVELISGINATETRVKNIQSPKVLHIATHGFFFKDQEKLKRSNMISNDNKNNFSNPMTRSGLVFAGAENTINGEILDIDNGWLSSYEASLLNLRGTELVVLSACETGSGDVLNGKGVYGLQRAIKVAGAESLIMSMWEVDDKATQELMTYFYDYWIDKKMTKRRAFKMAQEIIRKKYMHPYYWGAFIMI